MLGTQRASAKTAKAISEAGKWFLSECIYWGRIGRDDHNNQEILTPFDAKSARTSKQGLTEEAEQGISLEIARVGCCLWLLARWLVGEGGSVDKEWVGKSRGGSLHYSTSPLVRECKPALNSLGRCAFQCIIAACTACTAHFYLPSNPLLDCKTWVDSAPNACTWCQSTAMPLYVNCA